MKKIKGIVFIVIVYFTIAVISGCAGKKCSGYLIDYPQLFKPRPEGCVDFSSYKKLMIDPLVFHLSEEVEYKAICPREQKELSDTLHRILVKILADAYPLVDKPGPEVLRFRIAITDVFATKPITAQIPSLPNYDILRTIMPSGGTITSLRDESYIFTFGGEASMVAELLDSLTNERLAVARDRKKVEKYKISYGKWEHVEDAFEYWARRLRLFLDKVHGKGVGAGLKAAKL
jgi:hypothetical protein